jgi:predicted nuclease with TOPRIM domain
VDTHIKRLEAQLEESQSRIADLEAEIGEIDADDHRRSQIVNLKNKYAAARGRLNALREDGEGKWELYKADIWIAWNELENAFTDLQQQL